MKLPFYLKPFDDPENPKKKQHKIKHFGSPNQNHVAWLCYLEKCYAKALEGYFNMCLRGETAHALTDLTGAPTKVLDLAPFGSNNIYDWKIKDTVQFRKNELWTELKTATKKGRPICATSTNDERASKYYPDKYKEFIDKKSELKKDKKVARAGEEYDNFMVEKLGLIDRHSYSVLSCKELSDGTKLVLLRHIWGQHQWLGPWGFNHEIWRTDKIPKEEKKVLKKLAEDKHQFFMPFDDFLALFDEVSISSYQKGNTVTSGRLSPAKGTISVLNLEILKAGVYSIRVSQQSHQLQGLRCLKGSHAIYPRITLLAVKDTGVNTKLEAAACDARRDVFVETNFGVGVYSIFVSNSTMQP